MGVSPDAGIIIAFDEPVDPSSVEGAFAIQSLLLPDGGVGEPLDGGAFVWQGLEVRYAPPRPFAWGEEVAFELGAGVRDPSGNATTAALASQFRVRRLGSANFYATGTEIVSGSQFGDGYLDATASCTSVTVALLPSATARVGSAPTTGRFYRGYLTFSIAPLAELTNARVAQATLNAYQESCQAPNNPYTYGTWRRVEAWHVSLLGAQVSPTACTNQALSARTYALSGSQGPGWKSTAVTPAVQSDWEARDFRGSRSQFMLRTYDFPSTAPTSAYCTFATFNSTESSRRPYLSVTYEYD